MTELETDPILQFFVWTHLRPDLQPVAQTSTELAKTLPRNSERDMCLRKLLEAKDCAVRTLLMKEPGSEP